MEREALDEQKVLAPHTEKERYPHNYFASRFPTCGPPVIAPDEKTIVKLRPSEMRERAPQVQRAPPTHTFLTQDSQEASSPINKQISVITEGTVLTNKTDCPSLVYGPEWHIPSRDLLINRHTTKSSICPYQFGTEDEEDDFSEVTEVAELISLDQVSKIQKRKARLLGKAKSWAYDLGSEDQFVTDIKRDESLTAKMRQQILRDPDGESEKDSFLSDDVSVASGSRRRSRSMDSYR